MRTSFHILALTIFLAFAGCAEAPRPLPKGTFFGTLPCADCPGIHYKITFENDSLYSDEMVYDGKGEKIFSNSGGYTIDRNNIITLQNKAVKGMDRLLLQGDSLVILDLEGKKIEGDLADHYILAKKKPTDFFTGVKNNNGNIDFRAHGNEPSWSLQIDFGKMMAFRALNGPNDTLRTPVPEPARPQDVDAVNYSATTESGTLQVTIFRTECVDDMSGERSDHKVRVNVKRGEAKDFTGYSGCGTYFGDYRLNAIWVLDQIDGTSVPADKKAPNLEFRLPENRFFGFGGCNRVNGEFELSGNVLKFGKVVSTRMTCPDSEIEREFLGHLTDSGFNFKIQDEKLRFIDDNTVLEFKKLDSDS